MSKWPFTVFLFFVVLVVMHLVIFHRLNTRIDRLDRRVAATEHSVDIMPWLKPTEPPP